jgi:fumarate reductase flavoprotein subunit
MMGGVSTDPDGATPLAGLYAAGETACVSINGANRLGSNSLPECLVFGARAGRAAAEYAAGAGQPPPAVRAQAVDEIRRIERDVLGRNARDDAVSAIRTEMQLVMEEAAGIYRDAQTMADGAELLRKLQDRIGGIGVVDTCRSFNTELVARLELANMLDVAECILAAGIRREESRGAHQRTDHTARDDERWLVHQLVGRGEDGTPFVERVPVTITGWPPGERVYGR